MPAVLIAIALAVPMVSPSPAAPSPRSLQAQVRRVADAYYQFVLGRYLESEGDVEGSIKAYREAISADPGSAEIRAELAGVYARQNRAGEAIATAREALSLDPGSLAANRVLGIVYADLARPEQAASRGDQQAIDYATRALTHLEATLEGAEGAADPGVRLTLARLYVLTSAFDKAITLLRALRDELPEAVEIVTMLADAYASAGRGAEAIAVLGEAAEEHPRLYESVGEQYERERRWKEAADAYAKAVKSAPNNVALKGRLAFALLNDPDGGHAAEARDLLADVLKASPGDGRTLYLMVQAQRLLKDLDGAEQTARRLMSVQPGSLFAANALAEVQSERREWRLVVETLGPFEAKTAEQTGGEAPRELRPALVRLGFARQELGDFDAAIAAFERARALAPDSSSGEAYLLQAHLAARHFDAVIERSRDARRKFPDDVRLARLEADALRQVNRVEEAVALLGKVLDDRPGDLDAHLALAELLTSAQRFSDAERVLREAQARFPDDVSIPFQIGAVFERQKRHAEAERQFRQVLARDPLHALTLNYLGYMLADRGERLDEAVSLIRRALESDPYNGSYLDSLGWAYYKQNKLDLAETNLRRAAEQLPMNADVQDHYGDLLFKLGRYAEAVTAWQRALAGDGTEVDRAAIERKLATARQKARQ